MRKILSNQIENNQRAGRHVSADKKLRMAQYIRAQNMDNRMKIRQREQILYGTGSLPLIWGKGEAALRDDSVRLGMNEMYGARAEELPSAISGTFRMRMAAAIILFIGFLLCDAGKYEIFGYTMNDIYGMISEDYFKLYESKSAEELPQLTELLKFEHSNY